MSDFAFFVPEDPLSPGSGFPVLCYLDQFAVELNTAWSGAITFTVSGQASNLVQPYSVIMAAGLVAVSTVETPNAGELTALADAVSNHVPDPNFAFTVANPPLNPSLGRTAYLSNCAREGGGTGCPCYYDGTDWRRCSDNAVATT